MVADALSSGSITNLDASPVVRNTAGNGASAFEKSEVDYVTPTAAGLVDIGSKYKVIRLPFFCKLQALRLNADAALDSGTPTLAFDVGAYYSDSTTDGTPSALQGTAISVNAFAAALLFTTSFQEVNALGSFGVAKRQQPLWQALGLSSDPGGFVDVVVAVHTAASAAAASHPLSVKAEYVY